MRTHARSFTLFVLATCLSQPIGAQSIHRQRVVITVGQNVHISQARRDLAHYESLAAGDPVHPGRMISCTHVMARRGLVVGEQQCYGTFDGGKSWAPTLRVASGSWNGDPTEAYGRGDTVYVAALVRGDSAKPDTSVQRTQLYRSPNGGRTWEEGAGFTYIDREYLAVDRTNGRFGGRIYLVGQGWVSPVTGAGSRSSLQLFRSLDGGKSFLGPIHAAYPEGSEIFVVGTSAVLADGTYVAPFSFTKPGRGQRIEVEPLAGANAEMHVILSEDGGESFTPSYKIADVRLDRPRSPGGFMSQLAVDPGSEAFKDRLYVVFPALTDDRIQVHFSYSADKGKTWSGPVIVNDDRSPEEGGKGPDHILPSLAVNQDGVVLVTWYDRREARENLGWRLRAAASLDGGETFSASVPVASAANAYAPDANWDVLASVSTGGGSVNISSWINPFYVSAGHTTGLAVDASGTFYPTWIDNRTGIPQLWGAPITVGGKAVRNGVPELSGLEDVSKQLQFEVMSRTFDRGSGMLSMTVRLRNSSKDTIQGPVKLRVRTLESKLGIPEIIGADNGERGTGAIWDFSATLPGGALAPGVSSGERKLEFKITSLRELKAGRSNFQRQILNADAAIYGRVIKVPDGTAPSSWPSS